MKTFALGLAALAATGALVCAQPPDRPAQPPVLVAQPPQGAEAASRFDALFFKAYYLEHGAKQEDEAVKLYQEYIANTQGKGPYIRQAATQLSNLFQKRGDVEGARTLRQRFGLEGGPGRPEGGRGQVDPAQWLERQNAMLQGLEARLREMETADPQSPRLERLRQQIEELKALVARVKAGEAPPPEPRFGRGPIGLGGGAGAPQIPSLTSMPPAERGPFVENRAAMTEQMAERMAERNPEMAARLKERAAQMRKLAAEGKWEELDALLQQAGGLRGAQRGEQQQPPQRPSLAQMQPEERAQAFGQMLERSRSAAARLREAGNEEAAARLLETAAKAEKLAAEGKWEEVDTLLRQSMQGLRGGRRGEGAPEGGQRPGGRRREGAPEGGQRPGAGGRG